MTPLQVTISLLRGWYWRRRPGTRRLLRELPDIIFAIGLGLMLAYFAAQGF